MSDSDRESVKRDLMQILEIVYNHDVGSFGTTIVEQNCLAIWIEVGGTKLSEIQPGRSDGTDIERGEKS